MAIQRPAPSPPQKKKSGMGCFGCGCLLLIVILLVLAGLVGGAGYGLYKYALVVTSTAPATFAPFNGSDDIYTNAQNKLNVFNQAVGTGNPTTLTLSADEINAELRRNPDLAKYQIRILVALNGDQARFQLTMPTDQLSDGALKGRYLNLDATFGISFNADTKNIEFELHKAQIGDTVAPDNALPMLQANLSQFANQELRKTPAAWDVIQTAKTIAIKDGQLVIETK